MVLVNLGTSDLEEYMQAQSVAAVILRLNVPTPTVDAAAQAVNAKPDQIIKSILFLVDQQPVLAIACGTSNIARRAIAGIFGVGKKRVKLANADMVLETSGYEVGAMPPFGHRQPLTTLIDRRVLELSEAYAGGGAENALLQLDPQEILRVTRAQVLDLLE